MATTNDERAERIDDAGFPRVARLLRAGNESAAWRELLRFAPCSLGESLALDRAKRAMPGREIEPEFCDDDIEG